MNSDNIQLGQNIFIHAIDLHEEQRKNYINESCKGDLDLEQYVNGLIAAHFSAKDYFDDLEESITSSQLNEIEDHLFRDSDFGNYQIINILKQGGMGTIFLARRSDGEFERKVVIKMIPIDLNSKYSQSQFSHEKEILASLVHPNIVQLYDSGITEKGQSYFVMELVKGKTIINYCNDNKLTIQARLELFHEVLMAVGYAHQHLVIHGDIKPSNIMVNEDGQIKLLDFGIAKLVNQDEEDQQGYSLNYLTPEHKNKKAIITTTDIHQLGQLLYELLVNLTPKSVAEKPFDFPLLSQLSQSFDNKKTQELVKKTSSNKRSLFKFYHSDLQHIIAKALSVNPLNRYNAVQAFNDDLNLYSRNLCINARAHTVSYRVTKYIKRNKLLTVFVISMLMISVLFSIITIQHNINLVNERDKALKLKNLITDVFSAADPSYMPGKELTAAEVLDIGLKRVRERFATHSEIEADLLQEIAQTYQNLGKYEKAQSILQEVYDTRLKLQPNNLHLKAITMLLLGENSRLMSNNKQAKIWLLQSLEIFKNEDKDNVNYIASVKSKLGRVLVLLGDLENAETILNEATTLSESIFGEDTLEYAQALNDLNSVYFRQGKYKQVQQLLHKTKVIRENIAADRKGPILDKDYATNINNLGLAYYLQGDLIEGEKYFKQANILRSQIYLKPHPEQAQSLTNLGLLLNDSGRPDEALPYLQQALKIRKFTLSKGHMRINDAWNNLAMVYHENSEFEKAESIYSDIYDKVINGRGEKHPQSLSLMTNRANTLMELSQYQLAHVLFENSLNFRLESLPTKHLYLSYSYIGLGRAKIALGELKKGKELINTGLEIRLQKLPQDHWLIGEAKLALETTNFIAGFSNLTDTQTACNILISAKGKNNYLSKKCIDLLAKLK